MKFTIARVRQLILFGVATATGLIACGPSQSSSSQSCGYTTSSNWPFGGTFDPHNPAHCPIQVPSGGRSQDYLATGSIPHNASQGTGSLVFYDANTNNVTQSASVYFTNGTGYDLYDFVGTYTAGSVSGGGHDTAVNQIVLNPSGIASATSTLAYQTTAAGAILGLSAIDPGQSTTLSGEYYASNLVPPISYQWYKDWSAISGETGTSLEAWAGESNSNSYYEFKATDAYATTVTIGHWLFTTAGCGTQIEC